ncbi:DNA-directed RNA polymerase subunit delta [Mycoplasmopsis fermentans]|nr:hypothetical protein [Mycoplasmopsis fermentans]ADN68778.1 conserved hypothetical protein [Mycoplasmopsis fermentans JER]ADV34192.1 Conserved Hypothetical Protein [Mycoplasmopsis fermentans M64]VEU60222.1 Uncharacterised protein [Mycoplasmopsis fermentans]VEU67689.1 Uncharacterised protein [Mesomycoplasma conjunctivae]
MKTMLSIALEYISEKSKDGKNIKFNDIFKEIKANLNDKWVAEAENKNLDFKDLETNKKGELYRLLTVDSRFVHKGNNEWTIRNGFEINK